MSTPAAESSDLRSSLLAGVSAAIPGRWAELELVEAYLEHLPPAELVGLEAAELVAIAAAQSELATVRRRGEPAVAVVPTAQLGLDPEPGALLVLVVTEDLPFLVDTVNLEVNRHRWSAIRLFHPQRSVIRDSAGRLADEGEVITESWLALVATGGRAVPETAQELKEGVSASLAVLSTVVADWPAMVELARDEAAELRRQPGDSAREAAELLEWLVEGKFIFLGAAEFRRQGDSLVPLVARGLGILSHPTEAEPIPSDEQRLVVTRDPRRSPVRRASYLERIAIRRYSAAGAILGELRFLGLLSVAAYADPVVSLPVAGAKARRLMANCGFAEHSHGWKAVRRVIASFPRDELFEADEAELAPVIAAIAMLRERRQTRVFLRRSRFGDFVIAMVYLPRDRYTTAARIRIEQILLQRLGGAELDFSTQVSESVLTRLLFIVRLADPANLDVDEPGVIAEITAAARDWEDDFKVLVESLPADEREVRFSETYQADYPAAVAVADLKMANRLRSGDDLQLSLSAPLEEADPSDLRLKVVTRRAMSLTEAMPHLVALGAAVVDERPYSLELRGQRVMVYDFGLRLPEELADQARVVGLRSRFMDVFAASVTGRCEADELNRLVIAAGLDWRQVSWLRAISRYLQQAGVPFSQPYLATALNAHPELAAGLVAAFTARFDPAAFDDAATREAAVTQRLDWLASRLDAVASLEHDRILRAFLAVAQACTRTNAFTGTETLALKIAPGELELLPAPRPAHEIFVYSPRLQGVHLRFGDVARGGLRWSDRVEDFRTEVLSLVRAQLVKNTVIVPSGAKGGFVPQQLPPAGDRAAWLAEGKACYRLFVEALLSVTDDIVDGEVVPPPGVVRYDPDDAYLVVAADKGTATFSDLANEVSLSRGYWLGDAFASGGSSGYDHKAMGITARGAWESTKSHFAELGLDPARDEFTCVGIGDMSGDVFGNGMLASDRLRLVAAFNHQHIFLDPDPDPSLGFAERSRLFELPGSTWADYDLSAISSGGGVHRRDSKSIPITAEVARSLGLAPEIVRLTSAELISAILRAPVDLLFNGGVGTYVKAAAESHQQAGDKANDAVRVDGGQLRARCVVEGGNLGFTQRGRIEYALNGGRINTDFIDNSAGVDTSDHEVNIKILLAPDTATGRLTAPERGGLLASMTDEVAQLVLAHNLDQNLALTNALYRRHVLAGQHAAWLRNLVEQGFLDAELEALPTSAELAARVAVGGGLTRPELAVLLSYTKIALERWVLASDLPDDPYLADRLVQYFPEPLRLGYLAQMPGHRLARQIIATVAVNRFVNSQGMTCYHRLSTETGAGIADIIRAQLASRAIFTVGLDEVRLRRNRDLPAEMATRGRVTLRRMVERATRWLLHHQHGALDIAGTVGTYAARVAELRPALAELLIGEPASTAAAAREAWLAAGASAEVAATMATAGQSHTLLSVVEVADRFGVAPLRVAQLHYLLAAEVGIDELAAGVDLLPRQGRWEAMSRAVLRDELLAAHAELTAEVISCAPAGASAAEALRHWLDADPKLAGRISTVKEVGDGQADAARLNVGLAQLRSMLA